MNEPTRWQRRLRVRFANTTYCCSQLGWWAWSARRRSCSSRRRCSVRMKLSGRRASSTACRVSCASAALWYSGSHERRKVANVCAGRRRTPRSAKPPRPRLAAAAAARHVPDQGRALVTEAEPPGRQRFGRQTWAARRVRERGAVRASERGASSSIVSSLSSLAAAGASFVSPPRSSRVSLALSRVSGFAARIVGSLLVGLVCLCVRGCVAVSLAPVVAWCSR